MIQTLKIKQSTSTAESVGAALIHNLYLAVKDIVDTYGSNAVELQGKLESQKAYDTDVNYLTTNFPSLSINAQNYYIHFDDPEVERCLVTPVGDHGDGVGISTGDIPNITRLKSPGGYSGSGCFAYNNRVMQSFLELGRFTALTWLRENEFRNCTIKYIDLTNIQRMDSTCFYDSDITGSISLPNLSTLNGNQHFRGCTKLTGVTSLGYITKITGNMFYDCTNLVSVNLPTTCTQIDQAAFYGCENLTTINLENVTNILGREAFKRCINLETINFSSPLSSTSYDTFHSCTKLKNVTINLNNCSTIDRIFDNTPLVDIVLYYKNATLTSANNVLSYNAIKNAYFPKLSSINTNAWYTNGTTNGVFSGGNNNKTLDMIYLRDISSIPACTFSKTTLTLCVNNSTPPTLPTNGDGHNAFTACTINAIYVPDAAVSTYQSDSYWSAYSAYIQPISNCTKYATKALWEEANKPAGCLIEEYM